ncbi:MAG: S1 family peptidase, partial [Micrococcales bacterium]|nr:S1 family peptidase [Micrococcales bacterium]
MRTTRWRPLPLAGVLVAALALFGVALDADPALGAETASSAPLRAGKQTSACTANFLVQKAGTYMNLAAGHCGGVGVNVSLGGTALGSVTVNAFSKGTDAAAYTVADGASLTPSVFVSSTVIRPVVGQGTAAVGDRVCTRGASSAKEICGTVRSVGVSLTYLNTQVSGLVRVALEGGPLISGDSGAPVYKVGADGSAYAVGIAVLSDGTFTSISAALSATGTTLVTKAGGATPNDPVPTPSPSSDTP